MLFNKELYSSMLSGEARGAMNLKGVIWDLDGVITDTSDMHGDAWIEALQGIVRSDILLDRNVIRRYFDGVPRVAGIRRFIKEYRAELNDLEMNAQGLAEKIATEKNKIFRKSLKTSRIRVFNDAVEAISNYKKRGMKIGLASQSQNADDVIGKAGIKELFDSLATGVTAKENNIKPKPDKMFYQHAAELLNVDINQCIVFEDTYAGALSAVNAGAYACIGVARKNGSVSELSSAGCDIIVNDIKMCFNVFAQQPWSSGN